MIVSVVGATATGKSEFALSLVQELNTEAEFRDFFPGGVEIVGADAFQLYRGLDIGSAKIPLSRRREIPHHQIDVLWPDEEASVAAYQHYARRDVEAIQSRRALPLVVGGSGLYVRALTDELEFPPTNPVVRARWQECCDRMGAKYLHQKLSDADPVAASKISPKNARRLVRALEVIELTGRPFSASLPQVSYWQDNTLQLYCVRQLSELDERIASRTRAMYAQGLVAETEALLNDREHPLGVTAAKATGYRDAIRVVKGELSVDEAIECTALATRQLSRRQVKWFRRDSRRVEILMAGEHVGVPVRQACEQIRRHAHADQNLGV